MYDRDGKGVEKNKKKEIFHLEQAAIGGHPKARHNLGCKELRNGKIERAKKHFIIAANLGLDDSIEALKQGYVKGHVSKEEFAAALCTHQAAVDATKSPQREAADAAIAAKKALNTFMRG
jgi:TPR repeat protein